MSKKYFLLISIIKASLLSTCICFVPVLAVLLFGIATTQREEEATGFIMASLPVIVGFWLFRRLQRCFSRREAKFLALSFAVFTPIALVISVALAQVPGGYAGFLGRPFGLLGAFLSVVLAEVLLNFTLCVLLLRLVLSTGGTHPDGEPPIVEHGGF
jgi:hypothetical protein